jgi:hypothetical protein
MSEKYRPSSIAWGTLIGGVAAYDILAPSGETLSERVDTTLEGQWRYLALGSIAITAAHLANVLPERIDPLHQLSYVVRQWR